MPKSKSFLAEITKAYHKLSETFYKKCFFCQKNKGSFTLLQASVVKTPVIVNTGAQEDIALRLLCISHGCH